MGLIGRTKKEPPRLKGIRQEFKERLWGAVGGHYDALAEIIPHLANGGITAYKEDLKSAITREIMSVEYGLKSKGRGYNGIIMVVGSHGITIADLRRINTAKKKGGIKILTIYDVWSTPCGDSSDIFSPKLTTFANIETLKGDQKTEACRRVLIRNVINSTPLDSGNGPREGDWLPVVLVARSYSWVMRYVSQFLKAFDEACIGDDICYNKEKAALFLRSIYDGDKQKEIPYV